MKETNMSSDRDFYLKEIADILRASSEENERRHQEFLGLREEELAQMREHTRVLQEINELNKERIRADIEVLEQRRELERKAVESIISENFEKMVKRLCGEIINENPDLSERPIPPE
jgi:DNA-binding transcriptional MerR regulator